MSKPRAIVLITEGLNTDLVAQWGPELLPSFHRLFAEGAGGAMASEFVPYEPSGLFTAFTGVEPGEHGCYSYWSVHSPDYTPTVLDGSASRKPFLWHRPELADRTVAVVNVFGTHPVQPVNGYTVSYPMRRTLHACHPRELAVQLGAHGIHPLHDVTIWYSGQARDQFVPRVLQADIERTEAALHLLDGRAGPVPDLSILNLTAIDRLSHFYWQELEPGSTVAQADQAVFQAYQLADRTLGRLLDRIDDATSVLAFSEIGFGPLRAYCSLNEVLAEAGLLTLGDNGRPDWSRSRAFEAVQGSQGVNVNLAGRYKQGIVAPNDYEAVLTDVRAALLGYINPRNGLPLIGAVAGRDEI
jgi:predicted AlkP superfamily phosphohydrolase/phosphomutase